MMMASRLSDAMQRLRLSEKKDLLIDGLLPEPRPRKRAKKTSSELKDELEDEFLKPSASFNIEWLNKLQQ